MLEKTYKSYFDKIGPTDELIRLTKEKMGQEQTKKHFSFYKYGGLVAACLIIIVSTTLLLRTQTTFDTAVKSNESLYENNAQADFYTDSFSVPQATSENKSDNSINSFNAGSTASNPFDVGSNDSGEIRVTDNDHGLTVLDILLFPFRVLKALMELLK